VDFVLGTITNRHLVNELSRHYRTDDEEVGFLDDKLLDALVRSGAV